MTQSTTQTYDTGDARFSRQIHADACLEALWTGARRCEGPVYVAAGKHLLRSDMADDLQGRLAGCERGGRAVSRMEHDGSRTVPADHREGRQPDSANDVIVKSDGPIWFSGPTYGIDVGVFDPCQSKGLPTPPPGAHHHSAPDHRPQGEHAIRGTSQPALET